MSNSKEQYKRLINYSSALLIILVFMNCFRIVWYDYYNENMDDSFWFYGNLLMVGIYMLVYIFSGNIFNAFRLGYSKFSGLFVSQALTILCTNVVEFVLISLIGRGRLTPTPMIVITLIEGAFAAVWSMVFTHIYHSLYPPRKMIMIYGNQNAKYLVHKMSTRNDKYRICKAMSCDESLDDLEAAILEHEAVIISDLPNDLRNKLLKFTFEHSIRVYITPKLSDIIIRGADDFHLFDTPLLLSRNDGLQWDQRVIKRAIDLLLSVIAIALLSPFMLLTAMAIKLYDHGPVIYSQKRLTIGGKVFNVYKFRSMVVNAEQKSGATLAKKNDDRITPVGKIIRKIRFDELPQLFNILKGDMSFVGPRPERPEIAKKYEKTMPEFKFRLKVKAGLTGYAQVMGKYNTTPYDKLKLDLMYIERQSLSLDLSILFSTLKIVITPEATEGVGNDAPLETHRERIEHDSSKDEKTEE